MFELIKNNRRLSTIDSLFDNFFNDNFLNPNSIDYYFSNDEKHYFIELALPGINKKDINLNINGECLYLSYESKSDSQNSVWNRSFSRSIQLPNNINKDSVQASLKNGILTVKVEKDVREIENKKIEIK